MSSAGLMTDNTSLPSIISNVSRPLNHDSPSVMSVSSTKRYRLQQVFNGVQHDQQLAEYGRQTRHQLATADAEMRLVRKQLQKLEEAKNKESICGGQKPKGM